MSISILFVLIILRLVWFCFKSGRLKLTKLYKEIFFLYLLCSITINAGYAFKIGEMSVAFNTFFSLLLLVLSVPFLVQGRFNKKIMLAGLFFWVCIGAGLIWAYFFPYKGGVVSNIEDWDYIINGTKKIIYSIEGSEKLFNYILGAVRVPIILAVISKLITVDDIKFWITKLYKVIPFFIAFGFFEFAMKKVLKIDIYGVVSYFIGNVGEFPKLQGFTNEASQYAVSLFIFSIIIIVYAKFMTPSTGKMFRRKSEYVSLLLVYLLMILNTALTSYYLLFLSILILLIMVDANKKVLFSASAAFLLIVILLVGLPDYFTERFGMIGKVISTLRSGSEFHSVVTSEGARLSSIYYAVKAAIARPLFGIGIGNIDVHSMFFSILPNFGFIGTICYFYMWKKFAVRKTSRSRKLFVLVIASMFLSGGLGYFMELYLPFSLLILNSTERGVHQ